MANAGIFYEFIPLADYDDSRLEHLGGKAVPLAGVQVGVDYALVMTTPAGLARYVIGDIVRFTSTQPPHLVYVGRTKLQLSAFGEHVIEKEVADALLAVCRRHACTIANFHVAPIFVNAATGQNRGQHEGGSNSVPARPRPPRPGSCPPTSTLSCNASTTTTKPSGWAADSPRHPCASSHPGHSNIGSAVRASGVVSTKCPGAAATAQSPTNSRSQSLPRARPDRPRPRRRERKGPSRHRQRETKTNCAPALRSGDLSRNGNKTAGKCSLSTIAFRHFVQRSATERFIVSGYAMRFDHLLRAANHPLPRAFFEKQIGQS